MPRDIPNIVIKTFMQANYCTFHLGTFHQFLRTFAFLLMATGRLITAFAFALALALALAFEDAVAPFTFSVMTIDGPGAGATG